MQKHAQDNKACCSSVRKTVSGIYSHSDGRDVALNGVSL